MGILARFLPNLLPGAAALFNPWVLAAGLAAIGGSFLYGVRLGHERLETFQAQVEAAGKIQEAKNAETLAHQKLITEVIANEYQDRIDDLRHRYASWVPVDTRGRALPGVSCPTGRADEAPADLVPLAEYRALAGICAQTTQQLVSLQEWVAKIR